MLAHEYFADDVHKLADVARSERGISTLHEVTGGDPSRSPGWQQFIRPYGGDQEVLVALRTRSGETWGMLGLYREPDRPLFSAEELRFLREVAPSLAEGARRGLLVGEATDPDRPEAPGLVILREDWSVESLTPGVERWLAELPDSQWEHRGILPPAVLAVAGRALRTAEGVDAPGEVALARVLSRTGHWLVLHGAALVSERGASRGGHRRAGAPRPHRVPADGRLRIDRARAGGHPAGAAGRLDGGDRRRGLPSCRRLCSSTSRASSTRPGCAAAANSWARFSSPTTNPDCATTSSGRSRVGHCVAGR